MRRPPGEDLEWIGRNGHLQPMVFRSPDDMKPPRVGHLDHLQRMSFDVGHIGIRGDTFHIDG